MSRCKCNLRLVGRAGGSSGSSCEIAKFKPWRQREIKRLYKKTIMTKSDSAYVVRAIVGTDMSVREHIVGIALDDGNRVIGIADGASSEKSVCAFRYEEMVNALYESIEAMVESDTRRIKRIIMGHNHPSGDAQASPDDIHTTKNIVGRACKFGGHPLVEHIIVSPTNMEKPYPGAHYIFSMRDQYGESMFGGQPCMDKHEYQTWDDIE